MQIFDDIRQSFSELVFNTVLTRCPPVPVLLSCLLDKLPFCRRIERCCGFVSILTLTAHLEGRLGLDAGPSRSGLLDTKTQFREFANASIESS